MLVLDAGERGGRKKLIALTLFAAAGDRRGWCAVWAGGTREECEACRQGRGDPDGVFRETVGDRAWRWDNCPLLDVRPEHAEALSYANLIEHGILPTAGGWTDQGAQFAACTRLIRSVEQELWRRELDE